MRIITLLIVAMFFAFPAKGEEFIPYLDSVPLMQGFNASTETALIFDKPEGRVIEVDAWCDLDCPDQKTIEEYYAHAMKILGWTALERNSYIKETETLVIEIYSQTQNEKKIIRFRSNG